MSERHDGAPGGALTVLGGTDDLHRAWRPTTDQVGRVLALAPVTVPTGTAVAGEVEDVVALAGRTEGPLLVLPALPPVPTGGRTPATQVLVPFDGTAADARRLRPLVARFRAAGVGTVLMHAMTEETRPRFWEGPGHHARAWRSELRRRHGADEVDLRIARGDPGQAVCEHAGAVDLVVMVWRGDPSVDRAAVVRAALGAPVGVPVLLLPARWADALAASGGNDVTNRAGRDTGRDRAALARSRNR